MPKNSWFYEISLYFLSSTEASNC